MRYILLAWHRRGGACIQHAFATRRGAAQAACDLEYVHGYVACVLEASARF